MPNSEDIATVNYGMYETNVKFTAVNRGSAFFETFPESLVFFQKLKLACNLYLFTISRLANLFIFQCVKKKKLKITEGTDFVDVIYPKPIGYKMFKKNEQIRLNLRSCQNSVWKNAFVWNPE
ncbi:hypothetical protein T07_11906 [Trichinella nelsoni]|uniref:Uncharacterized protein n=1 Tax=Trichinella nelsoni TaxID=6336 RepID=A0A0V0RL78_9BILA|nr:hypothetical protein T07_11906 [Trichinella nelsoni]